MNFVLSKPGLLATAGMACLVLTAGGLAISGPAEGASGGVSSDAPNQEELNGVVALSPTDVWAVGEYSPESQAIGSVARHWNGERWKDLDLPTGDYSGLLAVDGVASNDVWAVGFGAGGLVEHWNGSRWQQQIVGDSALYAVDALSATSVWAAGTSVEHWNGRRWQDLAVPGRVGELDGIAALSDHDVWVVGTAPRGSSQLVGHWDGKKWQMFDFAKLGPGGFNAVTALDAKDVWAVGTATTQGFTHTLIEHWDGTAWTRVASPSPGVATLTGVAAGSADDLWAVGWYVKGTHPVVYKLMTVHWDGTEWTSVPVHSGQTRESFLSAVSVQASTDAWAVGTDGESGSLTRHWDGSSWR